MIVVTGATGTVGSQLVRQLAAAKVPFRVVARDPEKAAKKLGPAVEVVKGDLSDSASLDRAFGGADALFLLASGPQLTVLEGNAVDAAKRAGIKKIVKLSVMGAQHEHGAMSKWHRTSEKKIEADGFTWTFLRPTSFMSNAFNWAGTLKGAGKMFQPTGDGKIALIDPYDIAAVALAALTQSGHEGKAYDLTGPVAMTSAEQIQILAKAAGKDWSFVDVPPEAARAEMLKNGMPAIIVDGLLQYFAAIKSGQAGTVSPDVEKALGHPGRTFETWAKENIAAFQ